VYPASLWGKFLSTNTPFDLELAVDALPEGRLAEARVTRFDDQILATMREAPHSTCKVSVGMNRILDCNDLNCNTTATDIPQVDRSPRVF
jgi:hypothetical protein